MEVKDCFCVMSPRKNVWVCPLAKASNNHLSKCFLGKLFAQKQLLEEVIIAFCCLLQRPACPLLPSSGNRPSLHRVGELCSRPKQTSLKQRIARKKKRNKPIHTNPSHPNSKTEAIPGLAFQEDPTKGSHRGFMALEESFHDLRKKRFLG